MGRIVRERGLNGLQRTRDLGFRALTSFADGLARTVDWYLTNERWWRSVQTGAYRDWIKLQYGAVS